MRILRRRETVDKGEYAGVFYRFEYFLQMSRDEDKRARKQISKLGLRNTVLYSDYPFKGDGYQEHVTVIEALEKGGSFEHKSLEKVEAHEAMVIERLTALAGQLELPIEA